MSATERAFRTIVLAIVAMLFVTAMVFLCGCSSQQAEAQKESALSEEASEAKDQNANQKDATEQSDDPSESEEAEEEDDLIEEAYKVEDLMPVEEAEEETGILADDAGTLYVDGEILVTLSGNAKVKDIDKQLKFCEFIKESNLSDDMLITGSIDHDKVMKGSTGQAIMLLHTAEDVTVPQAIAALSDSRALKKAEPNYIMQPL